MKKFVLLYVGSQEATPEVVELWDKWFASIAGRTVDSGNPFGAGKAVASEGTQDLPYGPDAIAGYTIINAESLDEAAKIAEACPSIAGVRVYEALPM